MNVRRTTLFVAALVALAACSPGEMIGEEIAENILESQEGVGDVEIDTDSGKIEVESEDGSFTIGGGEIPDGFPIDVPGGGDVMSVIETEDGSSVSLLFPADEFDSLADFYEGWIEDSGLEISSTFNNSSDPRSMTWVVSVDDDTTYSIMVTEGDENAVVTLTTGG